MKMYISPRILELSAAAARDTAAAFARVDAVAEANTAKVLEAFRANRVSDTLFAGTTGYGYNDKGREVLDQIYADIFGTEAALVRIGFVNGTHALTAALFANLAPGDTLLSVTGAPYDTLLGIIGVTGERRGSLKYYGVNYRQLELLPDGTPDYDAIREAARDRSVKVIFAQRSRGYTSRDALSVETIGRICDCAHGANPAAAVVVDNCYGEFVQELEPTDVGADLIAGSLIKNPGGGLAPTGGYVAGRAALVAGAAARLTAPGIEGECGATLGQNRLLYQGLFTAPHVVAQAVKTAIFTARLMELLGYSSSPASGAVRSDIIQTINFGQPEPLIQFCRGIQSCSPVDSFVTPEPWEMPGYDCPVIMAAGAFVQGASIELSADAPLREPYTVYMQGALTFESGKLGIMSAASMMEKQ